MNMIFSGTSTKAFPLTCDYHTSANLEVSMHVLFRRSKIREPIQPQVFYTTREIHSHEHYACTAAQRWPEKQMERKYMTLKSNKGELEGEGEELMMQDKERWTETISRLR